MNETLVRADSLEKGDLMQIAGHEYRVAYLAYAPSKRERASGENDYGYRLQHTSTDNRDIDIYLPAELQIRVVRQ